MVGYGFEEGVDYTPYQKVHPLNNQEITDHVLKIDMAKEISMLQRSEKGKQARQYFIQVEKEYNSPELVMARGLLAAQKTIEESKALIARQQLLIEEQKPKLDYLSMILGSDGSMTISSIADDYGMSGQKMNSLLSDLGVIWKCDGRWLLKSKYKDNNYTTSRSTLVKDLNGTNKTRQDTLWTQEGREFLYHLLKQNGIIPKVEKSKGA